MKIFTILIITVLLNFSFFDSVQAQTPGVDVGEKIPHNLKLRTQDGLITTFSQITEKKGLALFFVRSAEWCPYCQIQLLDLNNHAQAFKKAGYAVASLSYDPVDKLKRFSRKYNISYPMLSDPGSDAIKAFDLLNKDQDPGSKTYGIPYPAIFMIASDQTITHKFAEKGYKNRPWLEEVLGALEIENETGR